MTLAILTNFRLIWESYIYDILDIFIVALFIYALLLLLRRSRSYLVFFGLAITAGLYILAKVFNLQLTLLALQYFVSVSVVVFAIIFQLEIRKFFEYLGLIGTRQIRVGNIAARSPTIGEMVQACVKMAQDKIGALIVLQGRDSLETLFEGGIPLDGIISEEVILSIFDPCSEGHDGALIISNNRILKFGAFLPLSTNFRELKKHGTRHSAALGLSEIADAMCIVLSEEKGTISVCRDGKLKTLSELTDLEKELEKFIKTKFAVRTESTFRHIVKHNFWLKIGALFAAVLIWLYSIL